ncbi:MAG TPA: hypothetical protein VK668_12815 [Mucilaginibacter sp.]|nr:hypothetical protein [Mucilaginibacter sp.]
MVLSLHMEMQETEEQQPNEQGEAIYSRWAILGFSIFFTPIAGAILLMINLRSAGYKKEGYLVLLFSIVYQWAVGELFKYMSENGNNYAVYSLIPAVIGGGILAEYFFKKYFPENNYEYKSILKPVMVALLITIPLVILLPIIMAK